ncbi:MAG: SDR family NAD(P)-dependent oxidoreductase [Lachnospiraceae bacterium]|nr:SDR family NAD(P)-dependent oxidoreductase [Lachnospiraceae bacterium]
MNIVIITGASSGIGKEFARQMDTHPAFARIDQFWLVARSKEKLTELANSLQHDCRVFTMDITNVLQQERLENAIKKDNAKVRVLVNCAGYGIMGAFAEQDRREETGMIRLNCEALTSITHRIIPYMKKGSRIIQMASCAAFLPQKNFAVYAATKAYVLFFSEALGAELKDRKIYVTSVCPGPVDTPFFDIAEKTGSTLKVKKMVMVSAGKVVARALKDSLGRRQKSVYSLPIRGMELLAKMLPHSLLLTCMRVMEGRKA